VIIYASPYPLGPKSLELPLYHMYSLLRVNHISASHRNPQKLKGPTNQAKNKITRY